MSRKGDCWDNNPVIERFFGSLKSDRTDTQRYHTREQARRDITEYIEMEYNSNQLHSTLDYLAPPGETVGSRCCIRACPFRLDQNRLRALVQTPSAASARAKRVLALT